MRVDPGFEWLRQVEMVMTHSIEDVATASALPISMLAYEAEFGRHVGAQIEATKKMGAVVKDPDRAIDSLKRMVQDQKLYVTTLSALSATSFCFFLVDSRGY